MSDQLQRKNLFWWPALDGLRGIAILSVMLNHYGPFVFTGGAAWQQGMALATKRAYLGVDLFFVLSGFLITGILLDSRGSPNYLKRFYWRRSLRIFPLYFFYLLVIFFIFRPMFSHYFLGVNPAWYFSYLANWTMASQQANPFLAHLWSLSVEEQFYLIWPFAVLAIPTRLFGWFCGATIFGSLAFRAVSHGHLSDVQLYIMTPSRVDTLALGALMALALRSTRMTAWMNKAKWPLAAAGLSLWVLTLNTTQEQVAGYSGIALFFAAIVFWGAVANPGFLQWAPLRTLGKYSYGIYMFHVLPRNVILLLAKQNLPGSLYKVAFPLATFVTTLCIAWVSWRFIESPFLRYKDRYFSK